MTLLLPDIYINSITAICPSLVLNCQPYYSLIELNVQPNDYRKHQRFHDLEKVFDFPYLCAQELHTNTQVESNVIDSPSIVGFELGCCVNPTNYGSIF